MQTNTVEQRISLLTLSFLSLCILFFTACQNQETNPNTEPEEPENNEAGSGFIGYRGIWFDLGQKTTYEWNGQTFKGSKYSGGLATYTMKHIPIAIYAPEVNRTFFVYGGTTEASERKLRCMIGYYDHTTGMVSRPVMVHDKGSVNDPHDNPSLMIDPQGYIWVFVSGRATSRKGYKYRSEKPYNIERFICMTPDGEIFTYPQPMWIEGRGIFHFFTRYTGTRELYFESCSLDGTWSPVQKLAGMKEGEESKAGHYQFSNHHGDTIATVFNRHINGNVDTRTNIYFIQTTDFGQTWTTVDGTPLSLPLTDPHSPCLVRDYHSLGKNVYIKDLNFDRHGHPVILYLTSLNHKPGPQTEARTWHTVRWTGEEWIDHPITQSFHCYDSGSLWIEDDLWRVIAPTDAGPQLWGTGGEMVMWESRDQGITWIRAHTLTHGSTFNHGYARRPLHAHDPFYALWADGNPDKLSASHLYFCSSQGEVYQLPYTMTKAHEKPQKVY